MEYFWWDGVLFLFLDWYAFLFGDIILGFVCFF